MYCPKCGKLVEPNKPFCGSCGFAVTVNKAQVVDSFGVIQAPQESPAPMVAPGGRKTNVLVVSLVSSFVVIAVVGFFIFQGYRSYAFADISTVRCVSKSGADCKEVVRPKSLSGEIGKIEATDEATYREKLIQALKEMAQKSNEECPDRKSADTGANFSKKTNSTYLNLCNMDVDYMSKSLTVLERLYGQYPKAVGGVNWFSMEDLGRGTYGGFQPKNLNASDHFYTTYSSLVLNVELFSAENILKAKKSYEQDLQSNFHPKNTDYYYVYAHEAAHDMEYLLTLKKAGFKDLISSSNPNDATKVITLWNNYDISKTIVAEAVKNAQQKQKETGRAVRQEEEMRIEISGYANEKDKNGNTLYPETLAEAVTDYLANGQSATELSIEIVKILDREMSKI